MAAVLLLCSAGLATAATAAPAAVATPGSAPSPAMPGPGSAPLYISDYNNNRVVKLPAERGPQVTVPAEVVRPTGLAIDTTGDLYISDTGENQVVKVPADGGPVTVVPSTGLSRPLGLAFNPTGRRLYIADSFNDRVVQVPVDGGPQTTVPASGLLHPWGLALDAEAGLYISDFVNDRVVRVPADGGQRTIVPVTGLSQPAGLAVDSTGALYIADTGNNRVVKVAAGGGQTVVPAVGLDDPQGLAVDAADNLYIADGGNNRVVRVAVSGTQTTLGTTGLSTPTGLALPASPAAPTGVTATVGKGAVTVSFTPSVSASVTSYNVTVKDLGRPSHRGWSARVTGSPVTVTGLTPGHRYNVTVTATNAAGATSLRSAPSGPVTVRQPGPQATRLKLAPATEWMVGTPPVLHVEGLAATLTTEDGAPVAGRSITFSNIAKNRTLCTAVTDSKGVARCDARFWWQSQRLHDELSAQGYLAVHAGDSDYRASDGKGAVLTGSPH